MQTLTSQNFKQEVQESSVPVIVDFYATWCGPCRLLKPILENALSEADGRYKVFAVDIDASEELAYENNITAVPTTIVFKSGIESQRFVGVVKKETLLESLS